MNTIWLSSSNIADHENIDHGICRRAVDMVIDYYKPSNYKASELASLLETYIVSGETSRAIVLKFRQYVQGLQETTA